MYYYVSMKSSTGFCERQACYLITCIILLTEWLEKTYFPTSHKRLREQLEMTITWLKKNDIPFIRPVGGLYVYANFSKVKLICFRYSCMVTCIQLRSFSVIIHKKLKQLCGTNSSMLKFIFLPV